MDKKDEIILQQLDVIRSMTERNLRSVNSDFWGTPLSRRKSPGRRRPPRPLTRPRRRSPAARSSRRRLRSLCPRRT